MRVDWKASYQDREGGYTDFNSSEEKEYLPFWLVAARISYKTKQDNTIFIEVNNLLNNEYVDFGNIPQPGRWMRTGINITL